LTGCNTSLSPGTSTHSSSNGPIHKNNFQLNTEITITLYDSTDETIIDGCFDLIDSYEQLYSRTISTSEIYRINNSSGTVEGLSKDTIDIIQKSLKYSELSQGAFDITVEPVTSLWNFGQENQRLPSQEEITMGLKSVGYQNLVVSDNSVTLLKDNMGIDLGAVAKGYIADKVKEYLLSRGVHSAIINLGGNVLCVGGKPDGSAFKIGIQKPFEDRSETVAIMNLSDVSVVSSGIYERYFEQDGVLYHHILDPSTGYPYDNELISVTIISDSSTDGDCLSTTCFALGLEKGLELINSLENTYACFITEDGQLHYSEGFLDNITVTESE
jgi:thiamine biosynthesis lipoprotein